MKQFVKIISMIILIVTGISTNSVSGKVIEENNLEKDNIKRDLLVLMIAYPGYIKDIEKSEDGKVLILMQDGRKLVYNDYKNKLIEDKMVNPDLQDILEESYPLDSITTVMGENIDPGRIRHYGLLGSIYGDSKESVEGKLINIETSYGKLTFNKENGAATNLKRALDEIDKLAKDNKEINRFIKPVSDTYNYKLIQDTQLLSPHSYGIAIDLSKSQSDYWKWSSKDNGSARIASYPKELVQIFEKYGFIWGGKWSHFDIFHFEYRPEIVLKSKYFGDLNNGSLKHWYGEIPRHQEINDYITLINKVIDEEGGM